jgi:hypothetical protein
MKKTQIFREADHDRAPDDLLIFHTADHSRIRSGRIRFRFFPGKNPENFFRYEIEKRTKSYRIFL